MAGQRAGEAELSRHQDHQQTGEQGGGTRGGHGQSGDRYRGPGFYLAIILPLHFVNCQHRFHKDLIQAGGQKGDYKYSYNILLNQLTIKFKSNFSYLFERLHNNY